MLHLPQGKISLSKKEEKKPNKLLNAQHGRYQQTANGTSLQKWSSIYKGASFLGKLWVETSCCERKTWSDGSVGDGVLLQRLPRNYLRSGSGLGALLYVQVPGICKMQTCCAKSLFSSKHSLTSLGSYENSPSRLWAWGEDTSSHRPWHFGSGNRTVSYIWIPFG